MNVYRTQFSRLCPVNGDRIFYAMKIESETTIMAEDIQEACIRLPEKVTQEDIADRMKVMLDGFHTITAQHRSVHIETTRGAP